MDSGFLKDIFLGDRRELGRKANAIMGVIIPRRPILEIRILRKTSFLTTQQEIQQMKPLV
jgi:hypothetical protein